MFYASVRTEELGIGNNDNTSTYKEINDLSYNQIVNYNISDLSSKFGIENVSIKIIGDLTCVDFLKCIKLLLNQYLL